MKQEKSRVVEVPIGLLFLDSCFFFGFVIKTDTRDASSLPLPVKRDSGSGGSRSPFLWQTRDTGEDGGAAAGGADLSLARFLCNSRHTTLNEREKSVRQRRVRGKAVSVCARTQDPKHTHTHSTSSSSATTGSKSCKTHQHQPPLASPSSSRDCPSHTQASKTADMHTEFLKSTFTLTDGPILTLVCKGTQPEENREAAALFFRLLLLIDEMEG